MMMKAMMAFAASLACAAVGAAEIQVKASQCWASDTLTALFDRRMPASSDDGSVPRHTFWPNLGSEEWFEIVLPTARTFDGFEVYWFDDAFVGVGHCGLPAAWAVQTCDAAGNWRDVPGTYPIVRDGFSAAKFKSGITADRFRVRVRLVDHQSAGALEMCFPGERPPAPKGTAWTPYPTVTKKVSLRKNALEPLPLGSVMPEGWLKHQLDLMTEGLVGRLYESSEFLTPSNGWIRAEGRGWEEQPYWLRSFVKVAVLTQNARCLAVAKDWVEKVMATQDETGWFGPRSLRPRRFPNGVIASDVWGHMVMCEALQSWYEYTHDARVKETLYKFFKLCAAMDERSFIRPSRHPKGWSWHGNIQYDRAGDMLPCIFWMYQQTGDLALIDLADKLHRKLKPAGRLWMDAHNVNFAQRFPYEAIYSRRSGDAAQRASADYWYDLHMAEWGDMPRGAFASDENCRLGCVDPRYGTETCTWGELTRSFQLLSDLDAERRWADRNEDVVFNHAPAAYTPDWKELHYLTAPNQVNLDARTDHNYSNRGPMVAYSAVIYRCCRHNAAMTFPIFTENLVKKGSDGALVFWMYAPNSGKTVLDGNEVSWKLETLYPFRETAKLTLTAAKPLYVRFRVPGWAKGFTAGGVTAAAGAESLVVAVKAGTTTLDVAMTAECKYTFWPRSGGVTIDRGPLSYSLALPEKYGRVKRPRMVGGSAVWAEKPEDAAKFPKDEMTEVTVATDKWNYALDVSAPLTFREAAWHDDCFVATNAPCEIFATGRRLAAWTLQDNQPAALQPSPAFTDAPAERLRFVPLGCQRCRLSVLPQATDDPTIGRRWTVPPATTPRSARAPITVN